jgi:xylulose-5-phosphate/fructose-6-phosphate phosphoketolase
MAIRPGRNHENFHARGYKEEGTTTTPFDMVVLNNLDRYQLALDAIGRIPRLSNDVEKATDRYWSTIECHKLYGASARRQRTP